MPNRVIVDAARDACVVDKARTRRETDPNMQCVMPRLGRSKGHFPDFPWRFKA